MGTWAESIPPAELSAVLAQVSELFGVPARLICSRSRDTESVQCRFVAWLALRDRGYSVQAIARAFDRDHSTVVHGLFRASRRPELAAAARSISSGLIPGRLPSLLSRYGGPIALPVLDYLRALCGEQAMAPNAWQAIRLIARNPCLQEDVACVLSARNRGHHYWRIRVHARQLGVEWY